MAVTITGYCIGSGDDLDPFFVGFGHEDWVGVGGSLTGAFLSFFIVVFDLVSGTRRRNGNSSYKIFHRST